jgi:hypothetical protein
VDCRFAEAMAIRIPAGRRQGKLVNYPKAASD